MAYRLLGKDNSSPPDVAAKVTGRAKYAEDMRLNGMVFCKVYESPMPHAKVRNIDASEALAMEGVVGILTADEVPHGREPEFAVLTNQPNYVGAPILAIAAIDETIAAAAVEKVKVDLEPLPFVVDPLDTLFPGGPNAHEGGNVAGSGGVELQDLKWTARDFAAIEDGQMPLGQHALEWEFGDIDGGFSNAALVMDESFVTAGLPHHCMEPRTAVATWENGKAIVYGSTQSHAFTIPRLARLIGIEPADLILVAEYCGGGFGSKYAEYPQMVLPVHFSKKLGRPVMQRVTRAQEFSGGNGRPSFQGRVKIGFAPDGRVTAVDLFIVHDAGANGGGGDFRSAGNMVTIVYQPQAMRWRGLPVLTNTSPRGAQRGPGENQLAMVMEPIMDRAAKELGIDRIAIRRINAPDSDGKYGADQGPVTSAYMKEALDLVAERFNWDERKKLSGQRNGTKVTGIGIGQAYHSAGNNGFDGLMRITPRRGRLHIHTGIGNLGTYSYYSSSQVAAEVLNYDWDNCVIEMGDTRRGVPWSVIQAGSNTTFSMTRAMYVGAMDLKQKLLEIAAMDLGGAPEDYDLGNEVVVNKADASKTMTYSDAAKRAIELGGKYSGQEAPEDIHDVTKQGLSIIAGTGLVGVAKDNLHREGRVPGLTIGMAHVEVDTETGKVEIIDYITVADVGTVMHPQGLAAQLRGGAIMGFGMALGERYEHDPQNGLPARQRFHDGRLPSYLDVPKSMQWDAVNLADPQNPVGGRGVGEPAEGSGAAAVISAVEDALGMAFNRTPIVPDMIINAAAGRPQSTKPLSVNTQ